MGPGERREGRRLRRDRPCQVHERAQRRRMRVDAPFRWGCELLSRAHRLEQQGRANVTSLRARTLGVLDLSPTPSKVPILPS